MTLADGNFTATPVARFDLDIGSFYDQPVFPGGRPQRFLDSNVRGVPDLGQNVRRARVGVQGTYLRNFSYNFTWELAPGPGRQMDFQTNSRIFELQTAYTGLGWGTVRVGGFTLLHTLEFSTSSFESMMMEKPAIISLATSLASGDSRLAGGLEARGDRWFIAAYGTGGVLSTLNDGQQRGMVGRAAGLAVNEENLRLLLGFNGAVQFQPGFDPGAQAVRLRDYPELRLEPTRLLDTRSINADSAYAYGPEISGMLGPVLVTAEYQFIGVDGSRATPQRSFSGYYIGASVPLFGGQRRYDRNRATWTRPRFEPLDPQSNTWGFAEVAVRYSSATLNDGSVRGGRQAITSVALNYYPSSQFRVSLQYSNGSIQLNGPDRDFQAIAVRLGFNL